MNMKGFMWMKDATFMSEFLSDREAAYRSLRCPNEPFWRWEMLKVEQLLGNKMLATLCKKGATTCYVSLAEGSVHHKGPLKVEWLESPAIEQAWVGDMAGSAWHVPHKDIGVTLHLSEAIEMAPGHRVNVLDTALSNILVVSQVEDNKETPDV